MNQIEKQFVPHKQSLGLRGLGFDEECLARHFQKDDERSIFLLNTSPSNENNDVITIAPLWQQAFDWFRIKYKLNSQIFQESENDFAWDIVSVFIKDTVGQIYEGYDKTHKGARLACLEKLIELCKKN